MNWGLMQDADYSKRYAYDANLQPVSVMMKVDEGEEVEVSATRYDALGRPSKRTSLDGSVETTLSYTPTGELRVGK